MTSTSYPRITFCTGVGTVTGANFLLETGPSAANPKGSRILVDCGLVQGERVAQEENAEKFAYDLSTIDALIITHAHLDHVGRIPKLVRDGYKGPIYSTQVTKELGELVMSDGANIIAMEARQHGTEPLYSLADVQAALPLWKGLPYHQATILTPDISIFLKDAGHILGSSMVEVTMKGAASGGGDLKALFTGDLGNSPAPLLRDTEPVGDVDYIVMESVYGDRNHEPKDQRTIQLEQAVKDTIARGGTLVIPSFAIDRTQVILFELNNMVEQGRIPSVPVFVDSPMAIKATDVYKANEDLFNERAKAQIAGGDDIFSFKNLSYTMSRGQSEDIENRAGAKIILAGSGMSVGGRIVNHEYDHLTDPNSTILLVGYQSPGSLGRALVDGARKVTINHQPVEVRAKVQAIYGYSAHKDGDHLVDFVATATDRLKGVFVVMGEPGASMHLAQRLNDELRAHAQVPERLKVYELER